jgi:hypothetical protein
MAKARAYLLAAQCHRNHPLDSRKNRSPATHLNSGVPGFVPISPLRTFGARHPSRDNLLDGKRRIMSISSRTLLLRTTLAAGVIFPFVASAQTPQPKDAPLLPMPQFQRDSQQSPTPDLQQMRQAQRSQLQSRIAAAIERIQGACREELRNYCSTVTPGEGRVLLCMQAHEDKLGNACEVALFDASRNIRQAMNRVERIADACWGDIQANCAGGGSIGQCINEKQASFSQQCKAVLGSVQPPPTQQQAARPQPNLAGVPIYSADGMKLGEVTGARMGLDGKIQLIQADIGSQLGLGTTSVIITPDELEWRGDGMQLRMGAEQVRAVLQSQRQ